MGEVHQQGFVMAGDGLASQSPGLDGDLYERNRGGDGFPHPVSTPCRIVVIISL